MSFGFSICPTSFELHPSFALFQKKENNYQLLELIVAQKNEDPKKPYPILDFLTSSVAFLLSKHHIPPQSISDCITFHNPFFSLTGLRVIMSFLQGFFFTHKDFTLTTLSSDELVLYLKKLRNSDSIDIQASDLMMYERFLKNKYYYTKANLDQLKIFLT